MTGAILPCILCQVPLDDSDVDRVMKNCDLLLDGGACSACKDYMAFEAKISATKQSLIELINQRPKMRERVNRNHDTLTNRIPLELVGSVFQFCASATWMFEELNEPPFRKTGAGKTRRTVSGPLLLGSICMTWRNIAWSMKPLWTVFSLHNDDFKDPNTPVLTKEWLKRADQLPLSIRILLPHHRNPASLPDNEARILKQVIAVINERSNQWEHLDILGACLLISQINGGPGGAPNLQALRIFTRDFDNVRRAKFRLMDAMPRPSRLTLNWFPLRCVRIEWTHLTHVCLEFIDLDESIELLRRLTKLVYCKLVEISESLDGRQTPITDDPTIYPALESLELRPANSTGVPETIMFFFKSFIFPNLKHLRLRSRGSRIHDQLPWATVVPHVLNSSGGLISFGIHYAKLDPISKCVIPFLKRTPWLRDLEIMAPFEEEWDGEENEFFQLLANTSSSNDAQNNFLPNLRSIKFLLTHEQYPDRFWNSIPRIFGPISDIHNSRRRPLKTLRVRTWMYNCLIQSADAVLQLLSLRREGIVLDLKDRTERTDVLGKSIERYGFSSGEAN